MSLAEHLYELRTRLAISFLAIGAGMLVVGLVVYQPVFDFQRFANNRRAVGNYCKKNGGETLMSAIQKSAR